MLDGYHLTNILRAFSGAQFNKMAGSEKTFVNLEPSVLAHLNDMSPREVSHVMYAYAVRDAGNPELHAAFEKRLLEVADHLDYPGLFNAIYYMLFRENAHEQIWSKLVAAANAQTDVLPIIYYKPFKAAYMFLKHHYPHWDPAEADDGSPLGDF